MADEKLNLEVILSASSQGVEGVAQKASLVQDAVDALNKVVPLGEKVLNAYSKTTAGLEKSFGGAASGAQKMAGTFETVRSEVLELDRRLQSAAETALSFGSQNIFGDAVASARMTGEEARKVADYYDAIGVNAKSAAKAINDAAEAAARVSRNAQLGNQSAARNQASARAGGLFAQGQLYDTGSALKASETSWAKEAKLAQETGKALEQNMANLTRRFKEERDKQLSDAQRNNALEVKSAKDAREQELASLRQVIQVRSREQSQGFAASQDTDQLNSQARSAELAALKQQILARHSGEATTAIQQQAGSLPTLRYALYDVSTTLSMAGVAMTGLAVATASAAITMDRQFADVLRTSEAYLDQTGASANSLRQEFEELFTSMPVSWSDLADIGTLAGQLNVAKEDIAEFTELVAMFAATTDVSIEQSATAFGRLSQLLDVPASEFENLGSSILAVGVNSVATESQIIAVSTQLASMGNFAGFTADEVFGLSSALASLGTQPELARGTITRLFTNISTAIASGSDRLESFGRIAGMTGQEFAEAWGDDAAGALLRLTQGLGAIEDSGAVAALHELGITAARDVPTILRLAQNNEVLAESLQVAADGYREGTALQDQYSVISSTVSEKIKVLVQNLQNFVAKIGQASGALGGVIDLAIGLTKALTTLADNPITATLAGIVGVLGAIIGPLALLAGLGVRGAASMIALRTALIEAAVAGGGLKTSADYASMSLLNLTRSAAAASGAARAFGVAARTALISTGIGVALLAIGAAWEMVENAINYAGAAQDRYSSNAEQFRAALQEDTKAFQESGDALFTFTSRVATVDEKTQTWQTTLQNTESILGIADGAVNRVTESLREQEFAYGAASLAASKYALSQDEQFQELANNQEFRRYFELLGADMDTFVTIASKKGTNAAVAYLNGLRNELLQADQLGEIDLGFEDLNLAMYGMDQFHGVIREVTSALFGQVEAARELDTTNQFLGISAEDTAAEMQGLLDTLFELENLTLGSENAIFNLGQTLGESGGEFGYFSEMGREGVSALISAMDALAEESGGSVEIAVSNFIALRDSLIKAGLDGGAAVDFLNSKIAELSGGKVIRSSGRDFSNLFSGWSSGAARAERTQRSANNSVRDAGKAAREVRKEVRTLLDYASDLANVWSRAFDIRFSGQSTRDEVRSTLISLREEAEEAARKIRDLRTEIQRMRADMASLESDINIQEYFLGIAIEYGDTQRAEAIEADLMRLRAELAEKTNDLADTQKNLRTEQDSTNKSLTGNSKAAIENRKTIQGLVQQYQAHIGALAQSGMSQDDLARATERLRQDFLQQATQLGYNRRELQVYAKSFDDVAVAIAKVPRNITVKASVDPAIQALNELRSRANTANTAINNLRNNAARGVTMPTTNSKGSRQQAIEAQIANITAQVKANAKAGRYSDALDKRLGDLRKLLASGKYWSGGFTGQGGKYEPAGVVHRGEYVIPKNQVNQATGLPYADALGRLMTGVPGLASGGATTGAASASSAGTVALTAGSIQAIAQAVQPYIIVDGQKLGQISSNAYSVSNSVGAN